MIRPRVTVYIPCRDYGRFLAKAIDSVFGQIARDWELIIVIDGGADESLSVARQHEASRPGQVRVIVNEETQGLRHCANEALKAARGRYLVRLDADDYMDEACLLTLAGYLDAHPDVALVYPNWTYVAEDGTELRTERRKKIGREAGVLDLPPHGACTMVRTRVLKAIGGYDQQHSAQDGHELWLKVLHRYPVANVTTPLFYYRQHEASLSRDDERILASRRGIKRALAARNEGAVGPRAVAVIPVKNSYAHLPDVAMLRLAGKPLVDYTLEAATAEGLFELVYVFSDDPRVVEHCRGLKGVVADVRPADLSSDRTRLSEVLAAAVSRLEEEHGVYPDLVAMLSVHTPLRRPEHIREALDTLLLYDLDTVISTYEDFDLHFHHTKDGLRPLNPGVLDRLRLEREALYVGNGAVHVTWRDTVQPDSLFEGRVGHIVMPRHLSHYIKSSEDVSIVAAILDGRGAGDGKVLG